MVEALWRGQAKWLSAKVVSLNSNGTVGLVYYRSQHTTNGYQAFVPMDHIRHVTASSDTTTVTAEGDNYRQVEYLEEEELTLTR